MKKKIKILKDEIERQQKIIKLQEVKILKLESLVKVQNEIIVQLIS